MSEKAMTGKDVLKRIAPVAISLVLIVLIALIVMSARGCSNQTPRIKDADKVYVKLGNMEITNDRLYTYMKQNYGVAELLRLVDEKLYATETANVKQEDLDKFIIQSVYKVDDLADYKGDAQKEWDTIIDSLLMNNLIKKEDVDTDEEKSVTNTSSNLWNIVRSYYKLQYARREWAKTEYVTKRENDRKKDGKEGLFDTDEIEEYYDENYSGTVNGLFIPFTSEKAALDAMKRFGINTNSTLLGKNGWITESFDYNTAYEIPRSVYLNPTQIYDAFIAMYNEIYAYQGKQIEASDYTKETDLKRSLSNVLTLLSDTVDAKKDDIRGNFELPLTATITGLDEEVSIHWALEENNCLTLGEDGKTVTYQSPSTKTTVKLTANLSLGEGDDKIESSFTYSLTVRTLAEGAEPDELQTWTVEAADLFEIYKFDYEKLEEKDIQLTWDTAGLTEINSTLASYLKYDSSHLKISDSASDFYKSYTMKPVSCGDYYFLMVKFEQTAAPSLEDETVKAEIIEKLTEELLTDNAINEMVYERRYNAGLNIYDRYLEAIYDYQYTYFYETTLKLTDYNKYKDSKKKEKAVIAKFKVGDKEETITADTLFNSLKDKYAVSITIDLINQYRVIDDKTLNQVYNPYTNEIFDKNLLKELLTNEVGNFRKNFELDYFTYSYLSYYGFTPNFPASYGWANFEKDYFGAFNDEELLTNSKFGGSIYTEALEELTKTLYTDLDDVTTPEESDVYKAMKEAYDKWFGLSVINLIVYVDNNYDSNIDTQTDTNDDTSDGFEDTTWTEEQRNLVDELIALLLEKAPETGETTISNQITALVTLYKNASYDLPTAAPTANDTIYSYNYWAKFKNAGLLIKFETSANYTSTSSLVQEFLDELDVMYQAARTLNLEGTFDVPLVSENNVETTYGYHKIIALAIQDPTELPSLSDVILYNLGNEASKYANSTVGYKKERYENAVKKLKDDYDIEYTSEYELDAEVKARIDAWYTNAVTEVSGEDVLSANLIQYLKDNKANIQAENQAEYLRLLDIIVEISERDLENKDK